MITIAKPGRFIIFCLSALSLTTLIFYIIFRLIWGTASLQHSGELTIKEGSAARQVWSQLAEEEFTSRTIPWRYHAWRREAASQLKAGTYQLTQGERVPDVIQRFTTGDVSSDELTITYPEGFTLQQVAARTAAKGIGTEQEFIQAAQPALHSDEHTFLIELSPGRDLEGYLFPDTYRVFADDTPADVIRRMLTNFSDKFSAGLRNQAIEHGRTLDDVIIMASIIEREVQSAEDMTLVSGILWQRLDDNTGLAADATVRYALDKWDKPLTQEDLQIDSPYNTRKYRGLPPGSISNPGLRAIVAAVRPEKSDYYYYLSTPQGETIFSRTLDEHNANKARFLK
ncbi:MAG: endolytic transglycosylase MltG [bacterium]